MKPEHKNHVLVLSLMLVFIAVVFGLVLWHGFYTGNVNAGALYSDGITTSLSSYSYAGNMPHQGGTIVLANSPVQGEFQILIAFLILLAFLFAVYLIVKIFREIHAHRHGVIG